MRQTDDLADAHTGLHRPALQLATPIRAEPTARVDRRGRQERPVALVMSSASRVPVAVEHVSTLLDDALGVFDDRPRGDGAPLSADSDVMRECQWLFEISLLLMLLDRSLDELPPLLEALVAQ